MLLLAKARADRLRADGKGVQGQGMDALKASADILVDLVETKKAGWLALVQNTGAKVDLTTVVAQANQIIGFHSERAGISRTVPVLERGVVSKGQSSE